MDSSEARRADRPSRVPGDSALRDPRSHLRVWPVAVAGLALDLGSKHWAFSQLKPGPAQALEVIPHIMTFQRSLNTGALFGLGKGLTPLFIAASLLALAFVLFLFTQSTRDRRSLHLALGLVLAGALGNLFDRSFVIADVVKYTRNGETQTLIGKLIPEQTDARAVTIGSWPDGLHPQRIRTAWDPQISRQGVVRDFVRMDPHIGRFHLWPWVFNVADVLLVVGVGLLILNFWWDRRAEHARRRQAAAVGRKSGV